MNHQPATMDQAIAAADRMRNWTLKKIKRGERYGYECMIRNDGHWYTATSKSALGAMVGALAKAQRASDVEKQIITRAISDARGLKIVG